MGKRRWNFDGIGRGISRGFFPAIMLSMIGSIVAMVGALAYDVIKSNRQDNAKEEISETLTTTAYANREYELINQDTVRLTEIGAVQDFHFASGYVFIEKHQDRVTGYKILFDEMTSPEWVEAALNAGCEIANRSITIDENTSDLSKEYLEIAEANAIGFRSTHCPVEM